VFILRYRRGIQLYIGNRYVPRYIEKNPGTDPTLIVQKSLDVCTQKLASLHNVPRDWQTTVSCMFSGTNMTESMQGIDYLQSINCDKHLPQSPFTGKFF
jgi:hypothetical protein